MAATIKLEGFKDLERELAKLATPTARKASARRALKKTAQPMAKAARDLAPRGTTAEDQLAASISVGTKLSKRQAKMHRKTFRDDRAAVEMFMGPGPDPASWNQEFGNIKHGAQPFMRPAFDQEVKPMLDQIKVELFADIQKAVARAERKAAKQAARA